MKRVMSNRVGGSVPPRHKRNIRELLIEQGPMTHKQIEVELGYGWSEIQIAIRELRREDQVAITLDRRYDINTNNERE